MTDHLVRCDGAAEDMDGRVPADADTDESRSGHGGGAGEPTMASRRTTSRGWTRWRGRRRGRVSKWDRPPDPKDWRYFVGALGKVLIATGLLMFGFVAYQLWGTGIETARAQNRLESSFEERFAEAVASRDTDASTDVLTVEPPREPVDAGSVDAGSVDAGSVDAGSVDAGSVDPGPVDAGSVDAGSVDAGSVDPGPVDAGFDVDGVVPAVSRTPSEIVPGGTDLSDEAVEQNVPVVPGEAFARLDIPKIGVEHFVVPGVTLPELKKGPGHYPDTPLPGQLGNASIAGHRTTYGAPFFDVGELVPGDEISVTMITGDRFVYRVTGLQVVSATDSWVITTRDPNVAELTLTTCDPKYTARDRLIVRSVLVPEKSSRVGLAEFYRVDESAVDEAIPGDDPTITADVPAETVDVESATGGDATVGESTVGDAAVGDAAVGDAAVGEATIEGFEEIEEPDATESSAVAQPVLRDVELDDGAEIDAFSQGWFGDRAAFSQIALWGIALSAISLLAYRISKRTRHDSIGLLVGIAPFLLCLYFFYQNINRLLPPGL